MSTTKNQPRSGIRLQILWGQRPCIYFTCLQYLSTCYWRIMSHDWTCCHHTCRWVYEWQIIPLEKNETPNQCDTVSLIKCPLNRLFSFLYQAKCSSEQYAQICPAIRWMIHSSFKPNDDNTEKRTWIPAEIKNCKKNWTSESALIFYILN